MSSDIELLDGAVPLVRGDEPWEWFVNFWDDADETTPSDLSGKTASAEIRWRSGSQTVAAAVVGDAAAGQVRLSLTAAQTAAMPLGRLSKLYIAINQDTEAVVPVDVIEGAFGVTEPAAPADGVTVVAPSSGAIIVLTDLKPLYVNNAAVLASLFIRLPPPPATPPGRIDMSFRLPVTALTVQDAGGAAVPGGPQNAYGPGAGLVFEYVDDTIGWTYWK